MSSIVGGGGLQFAIAAVDAGFDPVSSIAMVGGDTGGPDISAREALKVAEQARVTTLWRLAPHEKTGRTNIVYGQGGQRLMVSDPGANKSFTLEHISDAMLQIVGEARLVHVSGYAFLTPPRRLATLELMRCAKAGGAIVAVDLVPHTLHKIVDSGELFADFQGTADWLLVSLPTAKGMTGSADDTATRLVVERMAGWAPALAVFEEPGKAIISGPGGCSMWCCDYSSGIASRGHSARAQAMLLAEYLT